METALEGDLYVRCGPGTVKLATDGARGYIRTRFAGSKSCVAPDRRLPHEANVHPPVGCGSAGCAHPLLLGRR
jgi:hypothetical protein